MDLLVLFEHFDKLLNVPGTHFCLLDGLNEEDWKDILEQRSNS